MQTPQFIEWQAPPAHEYVLRATIPGMRPPITAEGCVSDSRLFLVLPDGTPITELVAEVPANTRRINVVPGTVAGPAPAASAARFLAVPSAAVFVIDPDGPGGQPDIRVSLTDLANATSRIHRAGRVMVTLEYHKDLGDFGGLEWWVSARDQQLDVELLWHRAVVGPDVLFRSARIETPGAWTPAVPDPACGNGYLVKPDSRGQHIIPQRMCREFFFTVHARNVQPEPDRVGIADWSRGGLMPAGFATPPVTFPPNYWAEQLSQARYEFQNLLPEEVWEPSPVSWLFPATGAQTSGAGGGIGRYPLPGVRWATSQGVPEAQELSTIQRIRGAARARMDLDPDGTTLTLPADGDWEYWDGWQDEGPWHWSAYPRRNGAYDPRRWPDHGIESLERRLGPEWEALWLTNSPLARLMALEAATRARLTFWDDRWSNTAAGNGTPSGSPGMGSAIGIWQGGALLAIAPAICLRSRDFDVMRDRALAHLRSVQMPSGCFTARQGGYPADRAPYYGDYLLQGAEEFVYLSLAAYSLGARDVVRDAMRGMVGIASDDGIHLWGEAPPGLYYFAPTGLVWPPGVRFLDETDWPWGLQWVIGEDPQGASYYAPWHMGISVALAYATQAPEAPELLRRYTMGAGPMPSNPRALLTSWGLQAPDDQASVPIENYWPIWRLLP